MRRFGLAIAAGVVAAYFWCMKILRNIGIALLVLRHGAFSPLPGPTGSDWFQYRSTGHFLVNEGPHILPHPSCIKMDEMTRQRW